MRPRPPRSARARARFRPLFFCALWTLVVGCAAVEFLTTRSSLADAAHGSAVAGFVGAIELLYSAMLIYVLGSDYRSRRNLRLAVATLFSVGAWVNLLLIGVRTLHLSPVAAASASALVTVAAFRATLGKVGGDERRMVRYHLKALRDRTAANSMFEASVEALAARRLRPNDRQTARVNGARALIARSVADDFPDGLVPASETLREVLAEGSEDWLLVLEAARELGGAMDLKASKHGDVTGYADALRLLYDAAERAPEDAGAMALAHHATAEHRLTLAGRAPSKPEAKAHTETAIAELRLAIAAVTPLTRRAMLPGLYAELAGVLAERRGRPGDLDEAIALCRHGQRAARWSRRSRVLPDLTTASLLLERVWETVASVDETTSEAAFAAAAASVRGDLREAAGLVRRGIRHGSSEQRLEALEGRAEVRAAREEILGDGRRRPAVAAAWRAAALASARDSVVAVRVARAWIEWANGTEEARWYAEAYQHLLSLVPRAVAARYLATERDRLLAVVQHSAEEAGYWLAQAGRLRDAAVALELGRALSISEIVGRDRPDLQRVLVAAGRPDLWERYEQAVTRYERGAGPGASSPFSTSAQRAWAAYDAVLREVAAVQGAEHVVAPVSYADLDEAAREGPLVYLAAGERLGYAIIATAGAEPRWLLLPSLTRERVRGQVELALEKVDRQAVAATLRWLWENGIADLVARLPEGALVTLVPVGLLGLLPVHAAGGPADPGAAPADWHHLADRVTVRYALNARTLVRARARAAECERGGLTLLAMDAPLGDPRAPLACTRTETEAIGRCWRGGEGAGVVLRHGGREAVLRAMRGSNVWHLACHCRAVPDHILDTVLLCEDGPLTLEGLLRLPASPRRLAVLSACQSHRSGRELPDEAMGLPGGLMQVGLAGVIASHWNVDDRSVVFLMARFHELWHLHGLAPAHALAQAQRWVRRATRAELHAYLPELLEPPADRTPEAWARWAGVRPFDHPRHWAPFALTGT